MQNSALEAWDQADYEGTCHMPPRGGASGILAAARPYFVGAAIGAAVAFIACMWYWAPQVDRAEAEAKRCYDQMMKRAAQSFELEHQLHKAGLR